MQTKKLIQLRITEEQHEEWREAAWREHRSIASFIRAAVAARIEAQETQQEADRLQQPQS